MQCCLARRLWMYLIYLLISLTMQKHTSVEGVGETPLLACEIMVVIDSPLFHHYKEDIAYVKQISQNLVKGVNDIYHRTVFTGEFSNINFRLSNIEVLYDFCNHCNQTQKEFLSQFSKFNYHEYCISMLFTYRDFPAGLAGLAWRGSACSETLNTGFITFLNNNLESEEKDNIITLAHEMGHLLGATHVDGTNCGERDDYIMSPTGTNHVYPVFSQCSIEAIHKVLREKRFAGCFKEVPRGRQQEVGFCGNGILEGFEQCDCGMHYEKCWDPCCIAGHVSPSDRYWNESARPCQYNSKEICRDPYKILYNYGLIGPSIFILTSSILLTIILRKNWRGSKSLFKHNTHLATTQSTQHTHRPKEKVITNGKSKSVSSHDSVAISQPLFISTTADISNTKTCKRVKNQSSYNSGQTNRPIIKEKSNPFKTSQSTKPSSQESARWSDSSSNAYGVNNQDSYNNVDESTSFITTPLSGAREGGRGAQSWPVKKQPRVADLIQSLEQQNPLSGQSVQNKEGYDPIPRRSAPLPSQVVATHSSSRSIASTPTPTKSLSSSTGLARSGLSGDVYLNREVNTSNNQSYDPRPRRSAPRPPR